MPRAARKAIDRDPDPLDAYSIWDIRIAKMIYYGFILGTAILVLGVWGLILRFLFLGGAMDTFLALDLGFQIAIIMGAITGHLFLLVLFYTLFRGGMVKLCAVLFKDRRIAKKWENYDALRLLVGIALLGLYLTIIALLIGILPNVFFNTLWELWLWMVANFGMPEWILYTGLAIFLFIGIIFVGLILWNKGVFWVLSRVKTIEEEIEVEDQIKKDALKTKDERALRSIFKKETGLKPIHHGKETKSYIDWKKEHKV